jgi:hypothetical protein
VHFGRSLVCSFSLWLLFTTHTSLVKFSLQKSEFDYFQKSTTKLEVAIKKKMALPFKKNGNDEMTPFSGN